jgi:hypothetical protein
MVESMRAVQVFGLLFEIIFTYFSPKNPEGLFIYASRCQITLDKNTNLK